MSGFGSDVFRFVFILIKRARDFRERRFSVISSDMMFGRNER